MSHELPWAGLFPGITVAAERRPGGDEPARRQSPSVQAHHESDGADARLWESSRLRIAPWRLPARLQNRLVDFVAVPNFAPYVLRWRRADARGLAAAATDVGKRFGRERVTSMRHAIHRDLLAFWGRVSTLRIPRRP